MNKYKLFKPSITSLAILGALPLVAAESPEPSENSEVKDVEVISITGSRIKRQNETPSPVQIFDQEALGRTGGVSIGEILQELPSVGSSLNGNGSSGTSHGSSSLNLRNLGANRSLVLVNGQRWVNGAGTRGFRDFVDMNTIPQGIIKSVEVLQDGATAIYGADAIAGVVNIQTHDEFDGLRLKGTYGQTTEADRNTTALEALYGKNVGEHNFMFSANYSKQEPIYTQDREITRVPLNGLTSATPEGLFRENNLSNVLDFAIPTTGITRDPNTDGSDLNSWRGANNSDEYNRYFNNYVVGPSEKISLFGQGLLQFDTLILRAEALYNERNSDQQFSEVLSPVRGSRGFIIANDPRVNPFGVEFSGSDFRHSSFIRENGYRVNEQEVKTTRIGIGAQDDISDSWYWDAFLSYAKNEGQFTSNNQLHLDKLALGLRACDTTNITTNVSHLSAGCTPINLFQPLTDKMIEYINFTGRDKNEASQIDFTFNLMGTLMDLPAGELGVAAGIEYRKEKGQDKPDSTISSTPVLNSYRTTSSSPRAGTDGEYDLKEAYVEVNIPLLDQSSWGEYLEFSLASRISDYSTFGSTVNGKVGALYSPIEGLSFRATWAEGFRAPSILELFEGSRETFLPVSDPCEANKTLPGCNGVPDSYTMLDSNVQIQTGGNIYLQPEESENTSVGFIFVPQAMDNLSLTIDWYNIEISNTISEFGAQNLLDLCALEGKNCDVISRNSSGEITSIIDGPVNLNSTETSGIDFVSYLDFSNSYGDWTIGLNASHLLELKEESTLPDGSFETKDLVGTAILRNAFPEWRVNASIDWSNENWSVNYSARYIGETTETVSGEPRGIEAVTYHSIKTSYSINERVKVQFGINNLFDKQPPTSLLNRNINFDQNTYNPVGRYLYFSVNYEL